MANPSRGPHKNPISEHVVSPYAKKANYNEILPRLYLGDILVAINKDELTRMGITDMITVEIKPLSTSDIAPCIKRYLYINVMDHSKQDIMSHFEASNSFIESALKVPDNKVFVHCVAGISRSATLVIAYIMKTRSMNYTEALEIVGDKRPIVDPNEGFVRQLTLYCKMKYTIDIANIEYRRMILDALVFEFRLLTLSHHKQPSFPTSIVSMYMGQLAGGARSNPHTNNIGILFEQYYNKLNLQQVSLHPAVYSPETAYKCNKCRAIIFYAISVIENKIEDYSPLRMAGHGSNSGSWGAKLALKESSASLKECPFVFVEPQPWMSKSIIEREGDLECYKCKRKLGKFEWTSSESCSCARHNSHVNYNLFKIMKKKVDPPGLARGKAAAKG